METKIVFQSPASPGIILESINEASQTISYNKLIVTVAYATLAGCKKLVSTLSNSKSQWDIVEKKWLISLDFGTTDAEALEYLMALPKSEVRVYDATRVLNRNLRPKVSFHPKIYYFEDSENNLGVLISGSANLTNGGLISNNEQVSILKSISLDHEDGSEDSSIRDTVDCMIDLYQSALICNTTLIEKYRDAKSKSSSIINIESDIPNAILEAEGSRIDFRQTIPYEVSEAYWFMPGSITPNRGKNKPGNQIDLQKGSRAFFGFYGTSYKVNSIIGEVKIKFNGETKAHHLRMNANGMEKLTLPFPEESIYETYEGKILIFKKLESDVFELHLDDMSNLEKYINLSQKTGRLYIMKGGRKYGVM